MNERAHPKYQTGAMYRQSLNPTSDICQCTLLVVQIGGNWFEAVLSQRSMEKSHTLKVGEFGFALSYYSIKLYELYKGGLYSLYYNIYVT